MSNSSKKDAELHPSFTFDPETTSVGDVPTITRLLNRKKSVKPDIYQSNRTQSIKQKTSTAISLPLEAFSASVAVRPPPSPPQAAIKVIPAKRIKKAKLNQFSLEEIQKLGDPVSIFIRKYISQGADQVLWLRALSTEQNLNAGSFYAEKTFQPETKKSLWEGITLKMSLFPALATKLSTNEGCEILPGQEPLFRSCLGIGENETVICAPLMKLGIGIFIFKKTVLKKVAA